MTEQILSHSSNEQHRPWYKEPWLWLVIALPVASVIAGVSTVIIAYRAADDLVVDDYYKVGISINKNIESEQKAKSLGINGRLFFSGEKVQLQLNALSISETILPSKIMLELFHPTLQEKDLRVELTRTGSGLYTASFSNSGVAGRRYLRITPMGNLWNLKQDVQIEIGQPVTVDAR